MTVVKLLLKGFATLSQGPLIEYKELPNKIGNGFDPNAYILLAKVGYDRENIVKLITKGIQQDTPNKAKP